MSPLCVLSVGELCAVRIRDVMLYKYVGIRSESFGPSPFCNFV